MDDLNYMDHSRTEWYPAWTSPRGPHPAGDPVVRNSGGGERPRITGAGMPPLRTFRVHYVGAGTNWSDTGDTDTELRGIERHHAIPSNKPNEYNSASDSESVTWGYAGPFRAAHASGHNTTDWGHLVVIGLEDHNLVEDGLVLGVLRAREQLVAAGFLTPDHAVEPHLSAEGSNTSCPGGLWTDRAAWAALSAPLTTPPGDDMARFFRSHPDDQALCVYGGGFAWSANDGPTIDAMVAAGVVENAPDNPDILSKAQRKAYIWVGENPTYTKAPVDKIDPDDFAQRV